MKDVFFFQFCFFLFGLLYLSILVVDSWFRATTISTTTQHKKKKKKWWCGHYRTEERGGALVSGLLAESTQLVLSQGSETLPQNLLPAATTGWSRLYGPRRDETTKLEVYEIQPQVARTRALVAHPPVPRVLLLPLPISLRLDRSTSENLPCALLLPFFVFWFHLFFFFTKIPSSDIEDPRIKSIMFSPKMQRPVRVNEVGRLIGSSKNNKLISNDVIKGTVKHVGRTGSLWRHNCRCPLQADVRRIKVATQVVHPLSGGQITSISCSV